MPKNSVFEKAAAPIFIFNRIIFNFGFLIYYVTTWIYGHVFF